MFFSAIFATDSLTSLIMAQALLILVSKADSLSSIDDHVEARETVLGHEMSKDLASRKGLWDDTRNARKEKVKFGYQF